MESNLQKIADNTERIARYTEPKTSFYILLSDKTSRLRTRFNPPIEFEKDKTYEMGLVNLETCYSFPNIDATNNAFSYSPNGGGMWVTINIPEGCYEITDINEYVQRTMKENEHYDSVNNVYNIKIEANNNTLKTVVHIAENYMVDFWALNSIGKVFGFDRRKYTEGYQESENIVDIMSVSNLRVTSDIIGASYSNGTTGNIVYSFFPNVGPGYKIIETPRNLIYLPITLSTISTMETTLTDQNGKLINLRGEELSMRFHIREA
jgi:hypothetical protein